MLVEILLNLQEKQTHEKGLIQSFTVKTKDLPTIIGGFETYIEKHGDNIIDSLVLKQNSLGTLEMQAFCFKGTESADAIKGIVE